MDLDYNRSRFISKQIISVNNDSLFNRGLYKKIKNIVNEMLALFMTLCRRTHKPTIFPDRNPFGSMDVGVRVHGRRMGRRTVFVH